MRAHPNDDYEMDARPESYWIEPPEDDRELLLPWASPDPLPGEVEIVHIYEWYSMLGDTHSVRAWQDADGINYRVLSDEGNAVEAVTRRTVEPLRFAEVIDLVDSRYGPHEPDWLDASAYPGRLGFLEYGVASNYFATPPVEQISFSSRFYPQIADYYADRFRMFANWLTEMYEPQL